jgi:BirA family biotin operon repressor/biotin-[acetyl-CoA-carboxylase] ligase
VESGSFRHFHRLVVVPETPSTQDAARELCAGTAGLIVIAERQTAGRGRLGRVWEQHSGLAATFVVKRARSVSEGILPLAAGVAAAEACQECCGVRLALRWPNDVVTGGGGLKVAGVLIEASGDLAVVGVGINAADAPPHLPATSLAALGSRVTRGEVALALARRLDAALSLGASDVLARWNSRDCLVGTTRTFVHDGRHITGTVSALEPTAAITVVDSGGVTHRLPAASTSLVHG